MLLGKDFVMQGGVRNYLGETEEVNNAPRYWQSSPTSPKTELSYITDAEKKLLLDANLHGSLKDGKPNKGAAGLLSFDGWGDASDGFGGGGADANDGFGGGGENNNAPDTGGQSRFDVGSGYYGEPTTPTTSNNNGNNYVVPDPVLPPGVTPNVTYTDAEIEKGVDIYGNTIPESVKEANLVEKAFDLYKQYSPLGMVMNLGGTLLDKVGGASKSLQNKAIAFDLQNKLEKAYQSPTFDPFTPDASVTQLEQDLAKAQAGEFSQQEYQDRYAPQMNETQQGGSERDAMNALIPYAPYAITGQTPQQSMVQDYFSNMNINQGSPLSSQLQTDYNNAKNSISSILSVTPLNQQFGYSANPYGGLMASDLSNNLFNIPYLQQRGLI